MPGLDDLPELSPEGTTCRSHEARPALCVCPRCRANICAFCFIAEYRRCHRCVVDAPEELAKPLPFEERLGRGLLATMKSALSPAKSAASFAFGTSKRAFLFFLLTFTPLALLRGIVPYTHLVHFGPTFTIRVHADATSERLVLDVAAACGLALAESLVVFLALFLCYRSLAVAFGRPSSGEIATRLALYRAFLIPLGAFTAVQTSAGVAPDLHGVLVNLVYWGMPPRPNLMMLVIVLLAATPVVLLFVSMRSVARLVMGVEPSVSFALATVPWLLSVIVFSLVHEALAPLIPAITQQ